jgi:S1-C subfamily serine protease
VLVAYNGVALTDANKEAVKKAKAGCSVGTKVAYTVRRDGAERTLSATLAPVPDAVLAEWMKEEEAKTGQMAKNGN